MSIEEQLKAKYGEIFEMKLPLDDKKPTDETKEYAIAYFKKPDRKVLIASAAHERVSPLKSKETILVNCFVGGDKRVIEDDDLFLAACIAIDDIVDIRYGELKKK